MKRGSLPREFGLNEQGSSSVRKGKKISLDAGEIDEKGEEVMLALIRYPTLFTLHYIEYGNSASL